MSDDVAIVEWLLLLAWSVREYAAICQSISFLVVVRFLSPFSLSAF